MGQQSKEWYSIKAEGNLRRAWSQGVEAASHITSRRSLALAADISPGHLALVLEGQRKLSPETVEAVTKVLEDWGERCTASAKAIREAVAKAAPLRIAALAERQLQLAEAMTRIEGATAPDSPTTPEE